MFYKASMLFLIFCISIVAFLIIRDISPDIEVERKEVIITGETDIDMFIASRDDSVPREMFGSLAVFDILTKCIGDPLHPSKKGAVLTDINSVSYAVLDANESTTPSTLRGIQHILYINSGEGTIESGIKTAKLHEGIGVLVPPGVEFSIINHGDAELAMYLIEEPVPDNFRPIKSVVVKNEYDNPISTNIKRVNDSSRWLFSMRDGLSTIVGINPIIWEPRTFYPPHVHGEGDEEVWIAVKGEMLVQLGNKRRTLPAGSAYKVPPDGRTPHVNINSGDVSQKLLWIMKVPLREAPVRDKPESLKNII